jgi:hypothetical protein
VQAAPLSPILYLDDEGDTFLRNIGVHDIYTVHIAADGTLHKSRLPLFSKLEAGHSLLNLAVNVVTSISSLDDV